MNLIENYKAVFFDAGGTLFYPYPSVGEIYARVASAYGMTVDSCKVGEIFREEFLKRDKLGSSEMHATEKNEREWWRGLVRDVFEKVTPLKSFETFFEELYDLFASAEVWRLYPDVLPVLDWLKQKGCILGIVSNWDSRLLSICKGMGVDRHFDFILASALVGVAKPDRRIFEKALSLARVSSKEAIHVGDSLEDDIHGAQKAGLSTLWINRNGREVAGMLFIRSLDEMMESSTSV